MRGISYYENTKKITVNNGNVEVTFVVDYTYTCDEELRYYELESIDRVYVYHFGDKKMGVPKLSNISTRKILNTEYWERYRPISLDYIDEDFFIDEIYRDGLRETYYD